jgi:hypothetical protein
MMKFIFKPRLVAMIKCSVLAIFCLVCSCAKEGSKVSGGPSTETTNALVVEVNTEGRQLSGARISIRPLTWAEGFSFAKRENYDGVLHTDSIDLEFINDAEIKFTNLIPGNYSVYINSGDSLVSVSKINIENLKQTKEVILSLLPASKIRVVTPNSFSQGAIYMQGIPLGLTFMNQDTLNIVGVPAGYWQLFLSPDLTQQDMLVSEIFVKPASEQWIDTFLDSELISEDANMTLVASLKLPIADSVTTGFENIPVNIVLDGSAHDYSSVGSNPAKMRITDASGQFLDFDFNNYNSESGSMDLWVLLRHIKPGEDPVINILEVTGSAGLDAPARVFSTDYELVLHMDDGLEDATGGINTLADLSWMEDKWVTVDGRSALRFENPGDAIQLNVPNVNTLNSFSLSCWLRPDKAQFLAPLLYGSGTDVRLTWGDGATDGAKIRGLMNVQTADMRDSSIVIQSMEVDTLTWHFAVLTWDASLGLMSLFVDGALFETQDLNTMTPKLFTNSEFYIGGEYEIGFQTFSGLIDEIRLVSTPLNQERIRLEWMLNSNDLKWEPAE